MEVCAKYNVEPDIAVFGRRSAMDTQLPLRSEEEVMEAAQSTFISSTSTERIGPTAALKTLEVMEREKSWERITETGKGIMARWKKLGEKYDLKLKVGGLPAIGYFSFESPNALSYKTLITQEMLAKGFLASNLLFSSLSHTPEIVNDYFEMLDPIFRSIKQCEEGRDVMTLLRGPVCHAGFRRLN